MSAKSPTNHRRGPSTPTSRRPPPNLYHPPRSTNYINYPVNENLRNILFWLDLRFSFKVFLLCVLGALIVLLYFGVGFMYDFFRQFDEDALLDHQRHCYVLIGVQGTEPLRQAKCVARFLRHIQHHSATMTRQGHDAHEAHLNTPHHLHQSALSQYTMSSDVVDLVEESLDSINAQDDASSPNTPEPSPELKDTTEHDLFIVTEVSKQFYKEYIWRQLHSVPQPRRKDPIFYRLWMKWFNNVQFFRADSSYHNEEIGDEEIIIKQDVLQDVHDTVQKHPVFVYTMPNCNERRKEIIGGVSEFARLMQQNLKNTVDIFKQCGVPEV